MITETQPHDNGIDIMLCNASTTTLTKAKKRWRRAFFTIYFANTIAKKVIYKVSVSEFLTCSSVEIIQQFVVPKVNIESKERSDHHFINIVQNKDQSETIHTIDGEIKGLKETFDTDHSDGITSQFLTKMRIMFGSNTHELPTPVRLFYFAVQALSKDVTSLSPQLVPPQDGNDFNVASDQNIDQTVLIDIIRNKDLETLNRFDGVKGLAKALNTDLEKGIIGPYLNNRRRMLGSNTYDKQPPKGLFHFVAQGFSVVDLHILMVCAALSLGFGIKEKGIKDGWLKGGSIFLAVFLVIFVHAIIDFKQENLFDNLSFVRNMIKIDVVREGRRQKISIVDIVVGDVVVLNVGDQIPADGLLIEGYSMLVDESRMTGKCKIKEVNAISNPFLLSGTHVTDGYGRMLVLSVGMNTTWGILMSTHIDYEDETPLQLRLNKLIAFSRVGLFIAFLVLQVMLAYYAVTNTKDENGNQEYSVTDIFMVAVTIAVMTTLKSLRLAVTLTMMGDQAMVRKLSAFEIMGSATVICINKTGLLTMNKMSITTFLLGLEYMEPHSSNDIALQVLELLHDAVGFNTTGTVYKYVDRVVPEYSGSPTEKAILSWAVEDLDMNMEKLKQSSIVLNVKTFNSKIKRSGVLIKRINDNTVHVHWKGDAKLILRMCSKYYSINGCEILIDSDSRTQLKNIIEGMAASSLRCIAFAHTKVLEGANDQTLTENGLTLLGVVGLKDPTRPGSKKAIETCRFAGVQIKMITGDNVFTAKAIATECGILEQGQEVCEDEVVEGVQFRNFTDEERMQKVDKIRVMARSSPYDKLLMVKCLKQKGHVVAVTGDGTNDVPALKEADIGLSMGIQGTEVAKQSSDIVILDDDFSFVSTLVMWGRCVYDNIQKIVQFQTTVIVAALVICLIQVKTSGSIPLTAFQLLWVYLIVDTFGAFALATERPTKDLLNKPPVGRCEPLLTRIMWINILAQVVYQIIVLLTCHFKGNVIFNVHEKVKRTIVFNSFILCQVFNVFNSRKLEELNIFKDIHRNKMFVGIIAVTIILQIVMVEFINNFSDTERLNGVQWGICVVIAVLSWPVGWIMKIISKYW